MTETEKRERERQFDRKLLKEEKAALEGEIEQLQSALRTALRTIVHYAPKIVERT